MASLNRRGEENGARLFALILLLVLSGGAAVEGWNLYRALEWNRLAAQPESVEEEKELPEEVLLARARYLEAQNRVEEALRLYNDLENGKDDSVRGRARYNIGTLYLREAAKHWNAQGVWAYTEVNTLVDLAGHDFKEVLRQNPGDWDARFNLEYAERIRPPAKTVEKADWTGTNSSIHALMPGTPGGGP